MKAGKVVPFKHNEGLSSSLVANLREKGKAASYNAVIGQTCAFIPVAKK